MQNYIFMRIKPRFFKEPYFTQISVFSGFNQPNDISMNPRYETLCGISEKEVEQYFSQPLDEFAQEEGPTPEEMRRGFKKQYDGYHFGKRLIDVYNPFSVLNAPEKKVAYVIVGLQREIL